MVAFMRPCPESCYDYIQQSIQAICSVDQAVLGMRRSKEIVKSGVERVGVMNGQTQESKRGTLECSCCWRMVSHFNSMYWLLPGMLISYPIRMITKHGHIPKSLMPYPMLLLSLLNTLTRRSIRDTLAPIMHPPHAQ